MTDALLPCPFCDREPISSNHGALVFHPLAPCLLSKQHFDARTWNTRPQPFPKVDGLVELLREEARQEEAAHKMMADAKTARQTDRADAWTDEGYDWVRAEQTTRWKAADFIEELLAERAVQP